jgi:transcriptional regulator with XRE-family HTH domain
MGVGERIRCYRSLSKLSQVELARRLQMAPEQLNRYEKGRVEPTLTTTIRVARVLGVPLSQMLGE